MSSWPSTYTDRSAARSFAIVDSEGQLEMKLREHGHAIAILFSVALWYD